MISLDQGLMFPIGKGKYYFVFEVKNGCGGTVSRCGSDFIVTEMIRHVMLCTIQ